MNEDLDVNITHGVRYRQEISSGKVTHIYKSFDNSWRILFITNYTLPPTVLANFRSAGLKSWIDIANIDRCIQFNLNLTHSRKWHEQFRLNIFPTSASDHFYSLLPAVHLKEQKGHQILVFAQPQSNDNLLPLRTLQHKKIHSSVLVRQNLSFTPSHQRK